MSRGKTLPPTATHCMDCGARYHPLDSKWRNAGSTLQHMCGDPQAGHIGRGADALAGIPHPEHLPELIAASSAMAMHFSGQCGCECSPCVCIWAPVNRALSKLRGDPNV